MIEPSDFAVSAAWVGFRLNEEPISLVEGKFNFHVLMDAGSTYIIDQRISIESEPNSPSQEDVADMFMKGLASQFRYPKLLLLPLESKLNNNFEVIARENNIEVRYESLKDLGNLVDAIKHQFKKLSFNSNI